MKKTIIRPPFALSEGLEGASIGNLQSKRVCENRLSRPLFAHLSTFLAKQLEKRKNSKRGGPGDQENPTSTLIVSS